jgi:hypothetical protein
MPKRSPPKLSVIQPQTVDRIPQPPCVLSTVGMSLWRDIVTSYEFSDRASYETLGQACSAADRAEQCRVQIEQDGPVIKLRGVVRDHPLLKHELAARSFVVRCLARLGLDLEPTRGIGRPPGGIGITWRGLE